jgi:hypothetical protein
MDIKVKPPAGWKDGSGKFWIRPTKYGQKYRCKTCHKVTLGSGGANKHYVDCATLVDRA